METWAIAQNKSDLFINANDFSSYYNPITKLSTFFRKLEDTNQSKNTQLPEFLEFLYKNFDKSECISFIKKIYPSLGKSGLASIESFLKNKKEEELLTELQSETKKSTEKIEKLKKKIGIAFAASGVLIPILYFGYRFGMNRLEVHSLLTDITSNSLETRTKASYALTSRNREIIIPRLIEILQDTKYSDDVKASVIETLLKYGKDTKQALPAIYSLTKTKNKELAENIIAVIYEISERDVEAVTKLFEIVNYNRDSETRQRALVSLSQFKVQAGNPDNSKHIDQLISYLSDRDEQVAAQSAKMIGNYELDADSYIARLTPFLKKETVALRHELIQTFKKIAKDKKSIIPLLLPILNEKGISNKADVLDYLLKEEEELFVFVPKVIPSIKETDSSYQEKAKSFIVKAGNKSLPLLIKYLFDRNTELQIFSANCLGEFGSDAKSAIPGLLRLTSSKEETVRNAAIEAIDKIDSSRLPNANPTTNTGDLSQDEAIVNAQGGLILRAGAGRQHKNITLIPVNSKVVILDKGGPSEVIEDLHGNWFKIRYQNYQGWAFSGFLNYKGDNNELPDVE
ncbi:MAG: SH3 domain-containing protein [Leptospiraceae bacterium]|nr:SH3 domain-containing protein [Leptospiraceae bacterium]